MHAESARRARSTLPAARDRAIGRARAALTLVEVAISCSMVSGAALTALLLVPVGLRAQQRARFEIYAGCKALEMVDTFANADHSFTSHQIEAALPGENTLPAKWPVDLDRMMARPDLGLLPLPDAIAARLDSDGDEIARIRDEGGRLYYASPMPYEVGYHPRAGGFTTGALASERVPPPDAQSLVFAVVGYAQQNALPNHPCLAWPYGAYYPSIPGSGTAASHPIPDGGWEWWMWVVENQLGAPAAVVDDVRTMCEACPSWDWNIFNSPMLHDMSRLHAYLDAAQDIVVQLGIPTTGSAPYLVPVPPKDLATIARPWSPTDPDAHPDPMTIAAIRWLAAGALMRTAYYTRQVWPTTPADDAWAQDLEESCMLWTRRYAATSPYDWGAPRPLNHCSAWDFPLLEYDLFAPMTVADGALDAAGRPDATWRITAPMRPVHYARAYSMYGVGGPQPDNHAAIDGSWAMRAGAFDTSGFNLTAPFAAAERCRQIACWAVDWKAYEDYESAISGPYDASVAYVDSRGTYVDSEAAQHPPDLSLAWSDATRTRHVAWQPADPTDDARHASPAYRAAFFGLYGVDRDGNGVFDRGPLPTSARMRAVAIARWNYYDRRLISALRN